MGKLQPQAHPRNDLAVELLAPYRALAAKDFPLARFVRRIVAAGPPSYETYRRVRELCREWPGSFRCDLTEFRYELDRHERRAELALHTLLRCHFPHPLHPCRLNMLRSAIGNRARECGQARDEVFEVAALTAVALATEDMADDLDTCQLEDVVLRRRFGNRLQERITEHLLEARWSQERSNRLVYLPSEQLADLRHIDSGPDVRASIEQLRRVLTKEELELLRVMGEVVAETGSANQAEAARRAGVSRSTFNRKWRGLREKALALA